MPRFNMENWAWKNKRRNCDSIMACVLNVCLGKIFSNFSRVLLYIRRVMIFSWAHDVSTRVEIWTQAVALAGWQIAQNQRNILSNKRNIVSTSPWYVFRGSSQKKFECTRDMLRYFVPSLTYVWFRVSLLWYVCAFHSLPFVIIGWSEVLCFRLFFSEGIILLRSTLFCWIKYLYRINHIFS